MTRGERRMLNWNHTGPFLVSSPHALRSLCTFACGYLVVVVRAEGERQHMLTGEICTGNTHSSRDH